MTREAKQEAIYKESAKNPAARWSNKHEHWISRAVVTEMTLQGITIDVKKWNRYFTSVWDLLGKNSRQMRDFIFPTV